MKRCTWCGAEYGSTESVCAIDHEPLVEVMPPKGQTDGGVSRMDAWWKKVGITKAPPVQYDEVPPAQSVEIPTGTEPATKAAEPSASKEVAAPTVCNQFLFFIDCKGAELGPFVKSQVTQMWRNGTITADARYRLSETSEWKPILELFPSVASVRDWTKLLTGLKPWAARHWFEKRPASVLWIALLAVAMVVGVAKLMNRQAERAFTYNRPVVSAKSNEKYLRECYERGRKAGERMSREFLGPRDDDEKLKLGCRP